MRPNDYKIRSPFFRLFDNDLLRPADSDPTAQSTADRRHPPEYRGVGRSRDLLSGRFAKSVDIAYLVGKYRERLSSDIARLDNCQDTHLGALYLLEYLAATVHSRFAER